MTEKVEEKIEKIKIVKKQKWFAIFSFLLLVSIVTIIFSSSHTSILSPNYNVNFQKNNSIPMSFPSFGSCLAYVNVTMYGAFWCPHCQNEKKILGDNFDKINYIECANNDGSQNKICSDLGIKGYPTWEINGQRYTGEKSIQDLSKLTGCSVK